MNDFINSFGLTFFPLFIAVDAFGNLPFIMTFSEGMSRQARNRLINVAILTATLVGLAFLFFGQLLLSVLNLSVGSFTTAGGVILLILSIRYIISGRQVEYKDAAKEEMIAIVPIGTPLIVGPATITTLILSSRQYPLYIVLISLVLNLIISWIVFYTGSRIAAFLGKAGLTGISQVFNLLLAGIAVNFIFRGLQLAGIITLP